MARLHGIQPSLLFKWKKQQDVMLGAVEKRFGNQLAEKSIQWLTDNGLAYVAHETRWFARELNLEPCTTVVSSPQSNGMAVWLNGS